MRLLVVRFASTLAVAALPIAMMVGSGVASADGYAGQTYADAKAKIEGGNRTAVVSTVNGSRLPLDDCIVIRSASSSFLDASGNGPDRDILLDLDCNDLVATPGHPGNSVTTPRGLQAKKDQQRAQRINDDPAWCQKSDDNMANCERFCNRTKLCEI